MTVANYLLPYSFVELDLSLVRIYNSNLPFPAMLFSKDC